MPEVSTRACYSATEMFISRPDLRLDTERFEPITACGKVPLIKCAKFCVYPVTMRRKLLN
jgi:hypothetical protein